MSKPTEQDNIDYWNNLAKGTPFEGLGSVLRNVPPPINTPVTEQDRKPEDFETMTLRHTFPNAKIEPREDSWLDEILVKLSHHIGVTTIRAHETTIKGVVEQAEKIQIGTIAEAKQLILSRLEEVIGEDEVYRRNYSLRIPMTARNNLRADQRKRLGLREG